MQRSKIFHGHHNYVLKSKLNILKCNPMRDTCVLCVCVTALDPWGKVRRVFLLCGKLILLVGLLYVFVCSLDILSSAFQLVGGE